MRMQGLCPRTPGLRAADSASIPAGGSPPEDTGPVSWTVLLCGRSVARTLRASTEAPTRTVRVSSGGEPLAGGQRKSGQEALLGGAGAKPLRLQNEEPVVWIEGNSPRRPRNAVRSCDQKLTLRAAPWPDFHRHARDPLVLTDRVKLVWGDADGRAPRLPDLHESLHAPASCGR